MRRLLLLIGLAVLIPLALLALGAKTEPGENIEAELKSLKSQVASLEKRIKTLETQLLADKALKDLPLIIPQPHVPKGWQKRYFNGIPYYVIPLQQSPNK
jgi:Tfp pilus assembly protein PilO